MKEFLESLFSPGSFMPHGHCYLWTPGIVWLHVVSDALIVLAYYSIPIALVYFVRRRKDVEFGWIFVCFAIFILACGTTHLLEIWNVWHSAYWLSGGMKALTAAASVPTAILLARLMPAALSLASPTQLQRANAALEEEIQTRRKAEDQVRELNADLESRVAERTAELEGQRAELQLILDSVPALIFFKDLEHRLVRVNLELTRLMGVPREKLEGFTNTELGSPAAAQYHRAR